MTRSGVWSEAPGAAVEVVDLDALPDEAPDPLPQRRSWRPVERALAASVALLLLAGAGVVRSRTSTGTPTSAAAQRVRAAPPPVVPTQEEPLDRTRQLLLLTTQHLGGDLPTQIALTPRSAVAPPGAPPARGQGAVAELDTEQLVVSAWVAERPDPADAAVVADGWREALGAEGLVRDGRRVLRAAVVTRGRLAVALAVPDGPGSAVDLATALAALPAG